VALLGFAAVNTASAMEKGDWLLRLGGSYVDPKSNNHELVSVDSASSFTFNISYMMTQNWSVELLAAWPFQHEIQLDDGTPIAVTKHLPPTLSVQYHFNPQGKFQPYLGAGLNYTTFFSTHTINLGDSELKLDDSFGLAGELGADIMLNDQWFLNLSLRYISIKTDARLNGGDLGSVDISPWVYSGNVGFRF
jgi:outer membrane protein